MRWRRLLAVVLLEAAVAGTAWADPPAPPASVEGCWELVVKTHFPLRNQRGRFSFTVEEAALRGTVTLHGKDVEVRDGTVDGSRIRFTIERAGEKARFDGALEDDELRGTMNQGGRSLSWTGTRCRPGG